VERKLAAILAADVVGYTRLMGADEAGTLERLKSLRKDLVQPNITERSGRIVKIMGDGLLAEFPSVVEAVLCAVDIQQEVAGREPDLSEEQRIALRIGVNLGDVIVEGSDIYGDGVNIAARLEGLAEPGGICLSGDAYRQAKGKVGVGFEDLGEQDLKNVAEPVRVYRVAVDGAAAATAPPAKDAMPLPDKPSIAVLAFENMSGDPEQDYFADGLAEDIITELSRESELFVIARNSSFAYKGQAKDVTQIGRELGVGYVLEGSVRKGAGRIRLTAQLIDARTNRHVWAQRYDRDFEDVFAVQDELTGAILNSLLHEFRDIESTRALEQAPTDLDAYDHMLRAWALFYRYDRENIEAARHEAEAALALEPRYALALVNLAWYHIYSYGEWSDDPEQSLILAHQAAQNAVSANGRDFWGYATRGFVELFQHRHDRALASLERAVALGPNNADSRALHASVLAFSSEARDAADEMDLAVRLNPHFPDWYALIIGQVYFAAGRHQEAIVLLEDVLDRGTDLTEARLLLAANYAATGRDDDARRQIAALLQGHPDANVSHAVRQSPYRKREDLERYLTLLRGAGLPESFSDA
jgi:adenylate cyclase